MVTPRAPGSAEESAGTDYARMRRTWLNADTAVPAENSVYYYLALRKAGVPAEMHIFEKGPHGVGLANDDPALSEWSKVLANWLRVRGIIK